MIKLSIALCFVFFLIGCSKEEHPLINSEKARLVSEQVLDIPKCQDFRDKLLLSTVGDGDVEKIYHDATKLGCINKDI
jgi:hypothetical protein